jgi:hypothetical protein
MKKIVAINNVDNVYHLELYADENRTVGIYNTENGEFKILGKIWELGRIESFVYCINKNKHAFINTKIMSMKPIELIWENTDENMKTKFVQMLLMD